MRYTIKQQNFHFDMVYKEFSRDPSNSARKIWRLLREHYNLKLSRGYVNRLTWQAMDRYSVAEKQLVYGDILMKDAWQLEMDKIFDEFDKRVKEQRALIRKEIELCEDRLAIFQRTLYDKYKLAQISDYLKKTGRKSVYDL